VNAIGTAARFNQPSGIWGDGNALFISDQANQAIRKLVLATGAVTTVAGGNTGTTDAYGLGAAFSGPIGMWGDGTAVYVGDKFNSSIRQLSPLAPPTLASISPAAGTQGTVVPVTLTGTNFAFGATTITASGTGV